MEVYSECCDAPPEGELDESGTYPIGFCSQCKDHTVFYWDLPFEEEKRSFIYDEPFDNVIPKFWSEERGEDVD